MYTPVEDAIIELERRQQDVALKERTHAFLGNDIPAPLMATGRHAILARHLFTPDYELEVFKRFTTTHHLNEVLFEYTADKFIAKNEDKHALGKLYFSFETSDNPETNMFVKSIIDFHEAEGKPIYEVRTFSGESMIEFHHRILSIYYPESARNIYDISSWFKEHGGVAKEYYKQFLALFIRDGILFDNFRTTGPEADFYNKVYVPAIDYIKETLGYEPLICVLQEPEDENNPKWWGYDHSRMNTILQEARLPVR